MDELVQKASGVSILLISGHDRVILSAARIYGEALGLKMLGVLGKPFTRVELLSVLGLPE